MNQWEKNISSFERTALGAMAPKGISLWGALDPFGIGNFIADAAKGPPQLVRQGSIIRYEPHTHSAAVLISGTGGIWTCMFADELLSYTLGFADTHPAREGDCVLVLQVSEDAHLGTIIGRIPYPLLWNGEDEYNDPDNYHRRLFTQLPDTRDLKIGSFTKPLRNEFDDSTQIATNFRPTDIYPGEFAKVNQHNCGIKGGLFSVTLLGGGANLRLSGLSNMARLSCDTYKRHSMHGNLHEFHNGRYLSSERELAVFQEERLGGSRKKDKVWTKDSEAPTEGEGQTIKPRMKDLTGFFGNLSAKFCLRPDPNDQGIRKIGDCPNEEGVSRETIDPSGQYRLSAAGMIAIERTGRIPVPVRIAYPTDKDHEIPNDPEALHPFKHDTSDPALRQLELYDRQAYDLKNQYSRVDGLGEGITSDYYVPEESGMDPLTDAYDKKIGGESTSSTVKLNEYDRRRAGIYIGEDGSVIVRDAWGSEIVMLGGNITMSCAGNIMTLPGKTALTVAGDDIVQKAQNSIDIHASEHDVRLSAARNMEICGGADESDHQGGVIIESKGNVAGPWDGDDKGESARLSGITLKSGKQDIVIDGKNLSLRSRKRTSIVSGDNEMDGDVDVAAGNLRTKAGSTDLTASDACLSISDGVVSAAADTIGIYSMHGMALTKGKKILAATWSDTDDDIASRQIDQMENATEYMSDEDKVSGGYGHEKLDKMKFGFRTSEECGTDKSWTIGAAGGFRMYEPAWIQVNNIFETLESVKTKPYEENGKWGNGMPFPGKESAATAEYARLGGDKPENLTEDGFNADRGGVEDMSTIRMERLDGGYLIRK